MRILVVKNKDRIIVSKGCKKLIIDKDNELFSKLNSLSKEDIIKFYEGR